MLEGRDHYDFSGTNDEDLVNRVKSSLKKRENRHLNFIVNHFETVSAYNFVAQARAALFPDPEVFELELF